MSPTAQLIYVVIVLLALASPKLLEWLDHALIVRAATEAAPKRAVVYGALLSLRGHQAVGLFVQMKAYSKLGRYPEAAARARRLKCVSIPESLLWRLVNAGICELVTVGAYLEALTFASIWSLDTRAPQTEEERLGRAFVKINQAEALHNMGRDAEAHARLDGAEADCASDTLARSGLLCLRAWICIHEGQLEAARAALTALDASKLAPAYTAEVAYTWAALARAEGDYARALQIAQEGLDSAVRASSVRNGLVMLASIAALRGDHDAATRWFEEAWAHPYKGQAAYGLIRQASLLRALGQHALAEEVTRRVALLDPESGLTLPSGGAER